MTTYMKILEAVVADPAARCLVVTKTHLNAMLLFDKIKHLPVERVARYTSLTVHCHNGAIVQVAAFPQDVFYWSGMYASTILYSRSLDDNQVAYLLTRLRGVQAKTLTMMPLLEDEY